METKKRTTLNLVFDPDFEKYPTVKEKMINARNHIEDILETDEFKDFVLTHEYQGELQFADTSEENEEIYTKILESAEILTPEIDYEWDIIVIPYYKRFSKAIGYTYPSKKEIWVNMKYYNNSYWDEGDCAGNISHEHMHKLGYKHSYKREARWNWTVPYAVGNFMNNEVSKRIGKLTVITPQSASLEPMSWGRRAWYLLTRYIF